MIVREATLEDLPELTKLCRMFAESCPLVDEEPPVESCIGEMLRHVQEPNFCIVAEPPEAKGVLVGVMSMEVYRIFPNSPPQCRDFFVYFHPSYRGPWLRTCMLQVFERAKRAGCTRTFIHCIGADAEQNEQNARFLSKLGLQRLGDVMVKTV